MVQFPWDSVRELQQIILGVLFVEVHRSQAHVLPFEAPPYHHVPHMQIVTGGNGRQLHNGRGLPLEFWHSWFLLCQDESKLAIEVFRWSRLDSGISSGWVPGFYGL